MYGSGVKFACDQLGLTKEAGPLHEWFLRVLKGPHGELATRVPVQAAMGALAGTATGALADQPGKGALIGGLSGGLGGVAVAGAPKLRKRLIESLLKRTA